MKYKRNHYVPEFYLNHFSLIHAGDRKAQLWVYDKEENAPRKQSPRDTAVINDLYTVLTPDLPPNALEIAFGKQENAISPILAKWVQKGAVPSLEEIDEVAYFLALLHLRNPKTAKWFEAFTEFTKVEEVKALAHDHAQFDRYWQEAIQQQTFSPNHTKEEVREMAENLDHHFIVKVDPKYAMLGPLQYADAVSDELKKMYWCLCSAPTDWSFIASDSPVVVRYREADSVVFAPAFRNPTARVTFPISPQACLYLSRDNRSKTLKVDSIFIKDTNRGTAINAERYVFASLLSDGIEKLVKKYSFTRHQPRLDKDEIIENMKNRAKHFKPTSST